MVLCLSEGEKGFKDFLLGGYLLDKACLKNPENNPAFHLSTQDVIFNNLLDTQTTLLVNYDYRLRNFVNNTLPLNQGNSVAHGEYLSHMYTLK